MGAIIVTPGMNILSTGYTKELDEHMHAEEVAIIKAQQEHKNLSGATIYSSIEPCGERLSGKECCSIKIINSGIKRVIFALKEPPIFVSPKGTSLLKKHGISVKIIKELAPLVEEVNSHLIKKKSS